MRLRTVAGRLHNTSNTAGREFMNSRIVVACLGLTLAGTHQPQAAGKSSSGSSGAELGLQSATPASLSPTLHRTLLDRYCASCHNRQLKTAGVEFDSKDLTRVGDDAPVWEKVVRQLRTGAMPRWGCPVRRQKTYRR